MDQLFAKLRPKYFTHARPETSPLPATASTPWGVVMEIGYPEAIVTTVALPDGTCSVLRSAGGGFFGGGDPAIQDVRKKLLEEAGKVQPLMKLTKEIPLPKIGEVRFYLRTDEGAYADSAFEIDFKDNSHPLFRLYCAGLRILHEYLQLQKRTAK